MKPTKIALCLFLTALAVVAQPAAAAKIVDISVKKAEGVTQVVISGDDILDFKDFTLSKPQSIVVDIKGASLAMGPKTHTIGRGGVVGITTSQFDREGGIARVVIETAAKPSYIAMSEENDIIIAITTKDVSSFAEWKASTAPTEMAVITPAATEPTPPTPVTATPATPPPVIEEPVTPPVAVSTPPPSTPVTPPPVIEEPAMPPLAAAEPAMPPLATAEPVTPAVIPPTLPPQPAYIEPARPAYRPAARGSGRSVSLNLENAELKTVLRAMAKYNRRNIIIAGDIKGNVSMTLHNVSWDRAFQEIVNAGGLDYVEQGGIIRVASRDKLATEMKNREQSRELVTNVYRIEYAAAEEITPSLQKILTNRGSIQVDKRSNSLVIIDVDYKHEEISQMLRILDQPSMQVEIMARIVDIDVNASRDLGISWQVSNMADAGLNVQSPGPVNPNVLPGVQVPDLLPAGGRPTVSIGTMRSFAQLDATLNVLETKGKSNTISNPRITSMNNKEAKIIGGKKIPLSIRDASGNTQTTLYTIGIKLTTTPHINSANNIILDVKTEISDLDPTATILGGVVILTNEAETQIVLNDGETAVIGGLVQTKGGKTVKGVPILMDIPILGSLFRSTTTASSKREILIFLTPHIVKS
jgi:type IV pilus secretin PilQ/predicted competence protein